MKYYLNYFSDYDGQYRIGVENLENASIPVEYNPSTGMCNYTAKIVLKEMKEDGVGYYTNILNPAEPCYISRRCLHTVPAYQIPKECQNG